VIVEKNGGDEAADEAKERGGEVALACVTNIALSAVRGGVVGSVRDDTRLVKRRKAELVALGDVAVPY